MSKDPLKEERTWSEEVVVAGNQLVERVKQLIADGNVRRLIIRKPNGESLLEIPLTAGVAVGGAGHSHGTDTCGSRCPGCVAG